MPKYLMMIHESEVDYAGPEMTPSMDEVMEMHRSFTAAIGAAGATVLGGEALQPSSTASYLRNTRSDAVTVVDNPAPDLKEILGGYYLVEAAGDDQARELAALCPAPHGYIELRPIWDIPGE
jgi:hypothetical protein